MSTKVEKGIEQALFVQNEYGYQHQKRDAVLDEQQVQYMKEQYGLKTHHKDQEGDFKVHPMCVNCQARHILKYRTPGKPEKDLFKVKCNFVRGELPHSAGAVLRDLQARGDLDPDIARLVVQAPYDPASWAELMFGFRDGRKDALRWYQKEQIRCSANRMAVREGRRSGKALALDTEIPTPYGWRTMGDLQVGDQVFDENGHPTNVISVTDPMYDHDCYEVVFNDGTVVTADGDHLWTVDTKRNRKNRSRYPWREYPLETLTTRDMARSVLVGTKQESNYSIPLAGSLEYTAISARLPADPYVLGFWLGDGVRGTGRVTIGLQDQAESVANISAAGYSMRVGGANDPIDCNVYGLSKALRQLDVYWDKHIPVQYLRASIPQRMELLKGLMDTDGSIMQNGTCEYTSVDRQLALDVYELLAGLGFKPTLGQGESWLNGVQHQDRYRIYFNPARNVFKLSRKASRIQEDKSSSQTCRFITEIRPVVSVPVKCIGVDSPNHLYLATKACIPTHNTYAFAVKLLEKALNTKIIISYNSKGKPLYKGPKIVIVTPFQTQLTVLFDEMQNLLERNPELSSQIAQTKGAGLYTKQPNYKMSFQKPGDDYVSGAVIMGYVSGANVKSDGSGGGSLRGECLPGDTEVYLADGSFKRMDQIEKGDLVVSLDADGSMTTSPVTHLFDTNEKEGFKVTLASGRQFVASADHKFAGCDRPTTSRIRDIKKDRHSLRWKPLKDWHVGHYIGIGTNIPWSSGSLSLDELMMIGLMTGDGHCTVKAWENRCLEFTAGNLEIRDHFVQIASRLGIDTSVRLKRNNAWSVRINTRGSVGKLWDLMKRAGIANCHSYDKVLAPEVLVGTPEQRRALLGNLLAADGWICLPKRGGEVGYVSTSKALALQVRDLFQSFGTIANLYEKHKSGYRSAWVVSCRNPYGIAKLLDGLIVPGKQARVQAALEWTRSRPDGIRALRNADYFLDRIVSIESCGQQTMYDIEVAGTENFLIRGGIVTHNSPDYIYLDEMDMIPEDILGSVVRPFLATNPDVHMYVTSTPIGVGRKGFFYKYCKEDKIWVEYYLPSTVLSHWDLVKSEIESEGITSEAFKAEYMAEFIESGQGVFRLDYILRAQQPYTYEQSRKENVRWWKDVAKVQEWSQLVTVIGIDWNKIAGTEMVVVTYDPLQHQWFVCDAVNIPSSEFSTVRFKEALINLNYKWKPDYVYPDEGFGHHVIEDLRWEAFRLASQDTRTPEEQATVRLYDIMKPVNFSSKIIIRDPVTHEEKEKYAKELLVQNAINVLEEGRIWIPSNDRVLFNQLTKYLVLRIGASGRPVYGPADDKVGDHRLDAFMLALLGFFMELHPLYAKDAYGSTEPAAFSRQQLQERANPPSDGFGALVQTLKRMNVGVDLQKMNFRRPGPEKDEVLKTRMNTQQPERSRRRLSMNSEPESAEQHLLPSVLETGGYVVNGETIPLIAPGPVHTERRGFRGGRGKKRSGLFD